MPGLVEIPYGDGKRILIEVSDNGSQEFEDLSRTSDGVINNVGQNLETVSVTIVETSRIMMAAFQSATMPVEGEKKKRSLSPRKATLEFGIRFTAEGNIYLAKASGESTLKATIEWEFGTD